MKTCPNNHDNPDNAKFCRICGYEFDNSFRSQLKNYLNSLVSYATRIFNMMMNESRARFASMGRSSGFTPDMFPSINLCPCSVVKVDFQCKKGYGAMVVLIVLFCAVSYFEYQIRNILYSIFFGMSVPFWVYDNIVPIVQLVLSIIFLTKFIPFLRNAYRWIRYKMNADYIEYSVFMQNQYRIAKKGKLGLFDKRYNTVTMGSHYDNITKFDAEHILIERGGKCGLFSVKKMALIVPIRFDHIDAFKNAIVKCYNGGESYYYDVNGNKME